MAQVDRRTMMQSALAVGALLHLPSVAQAATTRPSVVLVDERFLQSAAFARHWKTLGAAVIDARREDLGRAWRQRIPDLLTQSGASIAGVTLWSDLLICEMCARGHGPALATPTRALAPAAEPGLYHWVLRAAA